ncbi:DNA alkylation repair protein [Xinfangfangia sp. D13-10-4-6]|uniref:HEAT repeat domain-containing protein n=1 Tax=Pseudogemmobacter hezensis TaxID=2737662 RepID=UPI001555468B|nr:HEAT repeat domain-containing protein [Pseudogemmobacter hezensis]NPD16509.1 DNA alkylation repair protein [Pseudogemmobacter hezensis]
MTGPRPGKRVTDIDPSRLALLNAGAIEAATLTECLAVDFAALMRATLPEPWEVAIPAMEGAAQEGISRRMVLAAQLIAERPGPGIVEMLQGHPSDTLRGWACFMIGQARDISMADRLAAIRPLADDPHFGVREWSWMAVRPHIAEDPDTAIALLSHWAGEPSERLRRFASEAIRPRGVWCAHLRLLRQQPEKALPVLEPLRADPAVYVQDSVGNWLNDASKDQPDWVRALCARWSVQSPTAATARICKRALRTIDSKG